MRNLAQRWFLRTTAAAAVALSALPTVPLAAAAEAAEGDLWARQMRPFLADYCFSCHGAEKARGDLDLERFRAGGEFAVNREAWEKVRDALETREMPPENKKQPTEADRQQAIRWVDAELAKADAALPPSPGRVTLRRLNRNEYRNTIRDLLAVDFNAHAKFPNDESGYGFDNIGDVLSLPPMLLEKYLAAAEEIAGKAIVTEDPARRRIKKVPAKTFSTQADAVSLIEEEVWAFYREGEIAGEHEFAQPGEYVLRLKAYGEQAGPELPKLRLRLDGREIQVQSVKATAEKPETYEVTVKVEAGRHKLGVAYINNFNADGDRNVYLASLEVAGPLGGPPEEYPESHRRVLPRRPEPGRELVLADEALRRFATRAYRRPPTDREVGKLVEFVRATMKDGGSFEEGIRLAVEAVLVSPHFLYRWELDPLGRGAGQAAEPVAAVAAGPGPVAGGVLPAQAPPVRELTDYELASRLSYFLWSSMPDEALFQAAARGELRRPEGLETQVRRMLKDAKSQALVQNFGGQWLQIRNLDQVEPDVSIFPGWSAELRDAMRKETELFLRAIMDEDRDLRELVDADFTFVNERLAKHYGIEGVTGPEFQRVNLPAGSGRGGVITMGSVLTITSVPTRTSPVLRGKWIMEQILGTPPPPPPPNVPPVETGAEAVKAATLRQRLELHRAKPDCIACHQKMDPLGFALENFDAVGAWRDKDGPHAVDNAAELPGGRKFVGAPGLKTLVRRSDDFPKAMATKLLTYGLGRGLDFRDRRAVKGVVENVANNDFRFSALVLGVVRSDPFLKRQIDPVSHEQHASVLP